MGYKETEESEKENGDEASKKQKFRQAVSLQESMHPLVEISGTNMLRL